jgi:hypothetical protein
MGAATDSVSFSSWSVTPTRDRTTDILVVLSDGPLAGSERDDPPDLCALTRDAVIRVLDAPG